MAADAARSAHDADRMSVCRRPVLCGQGNHCDALGNHTIPPCGKDCLSSPRIHYPFLPFDNNLPAHTWSFIRTYSCLARDYIYHPALQVSVAMILNYPNGMWARRCIYLSSLKGNCLAYPPLCSLSQQMWCCENSFDHLYDGNTPVQKAATKCLQRKMPTRNKLIFPI